MDVELLPGRAVGTVAAPPSKSCAHRLLICAALGEGGSVVRSVPPGRDVEATLACLAALGAQYERTGDTVRFTDGIHKTQGTICPCGDSGSTLRFLLPVALLGGGEVRFTGSKRLMERGVGVYQTMLTPRGIAVEGEADGVTVRGRLTPGRYEMPGNVSSQYASGLLLALPHLDGESTLTLIPPVESRPYLDLTVDALRTFGVRVDEPSPNEFSIPGGQKCLSRDVRVEGDWSAAAALLALNLIGGDVTVTGLNENSLQGDRVCLALFDRLQTPGAHIDLAQCPDLGPILFAAAAALGRGARFTGIRRLRDKESDRVGRMAEELAKFGVHASAGENDLVIPPATMRPPTEPLDAHNDHRIVMALALLCGVTGGVIRGAEAVDKSFPDYFDCLRRLGRSVRIL